MQVCLQKAAKRAASYPRPHRPLPQPSTLTLYIVHESLRKTPVVPLRGIKVHLSWKYPQDGLLLNHLWLTEAPALIAVLTG